MRSHSYIAMRGEDFSHHSCRRQAMRRSVISGTATLLMLLVGAGAGQVIHSLVSPNQERGGSFGGSVSGIGDVNNDGCSDVIVGARHEDVSSYYSAGRAYILSGATGTVLHELISPHAEEGAYFGWSVSGAGDVDNDGFPDVIVGTPSEDPGSSPDHAGRAYVFSGAYGAPIRTLSSPYEEVDGYFGYSVSGAGDVNNDGYADVVVGARSEDTGITNAGKAYVFDGATGDTLCVLISPNAETDGNFGFSVSGAGDVDGDDRDDIMVGALSENPGASPYNAGRAYIFNGTTGEVIHVLISPGEDYWGQFGYSVSDAGDINNDGYDDVIVGAEGEARAYVFNGLTGEVLHTLVSPNWQPSCRFGCSVSSVQDVNMDGCRDLVVGAYQLDSGTSPNDAGRAFVFSGATGAPLSYAVSPNEKENGWFGYSVSGAGDANADGYDDVIIGAIVEDADSLAAGRAYLFSPLMSLSGVLSDDELQLQWSTCHGSSEYWLYGASNETYFVPQLTPNYQHRIAVFPFGINTWADTSGVGDPDNNWAYLIVAVGSTGLEVYRSNRFGEWDFEGDIP